MITEEEIEYQAQESYIASPYKISIPGSLAYRKGFIKGAEYGMNLTKWISRDIPPKESGRYWVYVEDIGELGLSHFQCNASYCTKFNRWQENFIPLNVTHWTDLLPPPL